METIKISKQLGELSGACAYLSLLCIGTFLLLLTLLHFLKADLDPIWHMISEYAIARYGWMMQSAFACLAVSCVSLAVAGWPLVAGTSGKIGLLLLLIAAIGLGIAAFNNTDPINTPKAEMSSHGNMHGLGFMVGVPSLTIAIMLISMNLRTDQRWGRERQSLLWLAQLPWISIVIMVGMLVILLPKNDGKFSPAVFIGLPNRLWVIACCAWISVIAVGVIKINNKQAKQPPVAITKIKSFKI